ncbi:MAG: hypothetical protein HKN22_02670 [Bacteroidia bacterium]|nr:hypothetical protein [Bacteroidia bacterium]
MLNRAIFTSLILFIFCSCGSNELKESSETLASAIVVDSPSDLKGALISVSDSVQIEIDELLLFQDQDDALLVGKLTGTNIMNGDPVIYDVQESLSESGFVPLSTLSNFNWKINDSIKINVDTLAIRSFIKDSEKCTEIYSIVGGGLQYTAAEIPVNCYLSIKWMCDPWGICPIDTITFSSCIGFPPICVCTGFQGIFCNSVLSVKCEQVECSHPCTLIQSPGKPAIGCLCDI